MITDNVYPSIRRRCVVALLMLVLAFATAAVAAEPEIPDNPNIANRDHYVADPAGVLSPRSVDELNLRLGEIRRSTTCEVAVIVTPSTGDLTAQEYCVEVFEKWGLGKRDRDNGVLVMLDMGGRKAFIMPGYGVEGALPDIACRRIVESEIVPAMKKGDPSKALLGAVGMIGKALKDPAVAEELRSEQPDAAGGQLKAPVAPGMLLTLLWFIAGCSFLFTVVMLLRDMITLRRKDPYTAAMTWRRHMPAYWSGAVLSLGAGLIPALAALWIGRRTRNRPRRCDTCGARMEKLDEEADNAFLSPGQDLEERLNTVDYDVWKCPRCGTVERYPFRQRQLKYTRCPDCGTVAYTLRSDRVVVPPTTRREGQGVRTYECLFCHNRHDKPYRIPRKEDGAAAALAAGAVIGSLGHRGGGGGGSIGGGFGGGRTGGGGAGGGW